MCKRRVFLGLIVICIMIDNWRVVCLVDWGKWGVMGERWDRKIVGDGEGGEW